MASAKLARVMVRSRIIRLPRLDVGACLLIGFEYPAERLIEFLYQCGVTVVLDFQVFTVLHADVIGPVSQIARSNRNRFDFPAFLPPALTIRLSSLRFQQTHGEKAAWQPTGRTSCPG
jgi:hypothetical protein